MALQRHLIIWRGKGMPLIGSSQLRHHLGLSVTKEEIKKEYTFSCGTDRKFCVQKVQNTQDDPYRRNRVDAAARASGINYLPTTTKGIMLKAIKLHLQAASSQINNPEVIFKNVTDIKKPSDYSGVADPQSGVFGHNFSYNPVGRPKSNPNVARSDYYRQATGHDPYSHARRSEPHYYASPSDLRNIGPLNWPVGVGEKSPRPHPEHNFLGVRALIPNRYAGLGKNEAVDVEQHERVTRPKSTIPFGQRAETSPKINFGNPLNIKPASKIPDSTFILSGSKIENYLNSLFNPTAKLNRHDLCLRDVIGEIRDRWSHEKLPYEYSLESWMHHTMLWHQRGCGNKESRHSHNEAGYTKL